MFLHLRWYGINVHGYQLKTVNVSLPPEDIDRLEMVKKRYKIPYGEIFNRAIFYLKTDFGDKSLLKYRDYVVRERLDEEIRRAFKNPDFHPEVGFVRPKSAKRNRICFRMKNKDIEFLKDLSKGEANLTLCLHYLIRRTIRIYHREGRESSMWVKRLIHGYHPHSKKTFTVRDFDCRKMDEFTDRYKAKYDEKLTRSEIVALAYHLFKRRGKHRQQVALNREKKEGKSRGRSKKISVSFSYEGRNYWEEYEPSPTDLRAALYSLLKSKRFWALVDVNSTESVNL
jgi:hypothetical protein